MRTRGRPAGHLEAGGGWRRSDPIPRPSQFFHLALGARTQRRAVEPRQFVTALCTLLLATMSEKNIAYTHHAAYTMAALLGGGAFLGGVIKGSRASLLAGGLLAAAYAGAGYV